MKRIQKVWGYEDWLVNTELYCAKRLHITPGFQCSHHRHHIKDETFIVESGCGWVIFGSVFQLVKVGDSVRVPPLTWHRFGSEAGMTLLEISTHHDDADVERHTPSGPLSESTTGASICGQ